MTITLCKACGTSYEFSENPAQHCPICEDERQFVPVGGQQWITLNKLTASHSNKWQQHNSALFSIRTIPGFALISGHFCCVRRRAIFYGTASPTSMRRQKRWFPRWVG